MQIKALHIVGQLEPGGISTWLKALICGTDKQELTNDICCNYRKYTGVLTDEFQQSGCKVYHVPLGANYWDYGKRLSTIIKNGKYNVVHDHRSILAGASLRIASSLGIHARIAYHHSPHPDLIKGLLRKIYLTNMKRLTDKHASAIWCCSKITASTLYGKNRLIKDKRIKVQYGGFIPTVPSPDSRIKIRATFGIPTNHKIIAFICRMAAAKNPFGALDICNQVLDKSENISVLWVGDGPQMKEILGQANQLSNKSRIHFTGYRNDVADILKACDIFLQPSFFEGLPLATLEAVNIGIPVIGSTAPGLLEALPTEQHYLCSPATDINSHVKNILYILNRPQKHADPSAFIEQFLPSAMYQRILKDYRHLLSQDNLF